MIEYVKDVAQAAEALFLETARGERRRERTLCRGALRRLDPARAVRPPRCGARETTPSGKTRIFFGVTNALSRTATLRAITARQKRHFWIK